MRFKGHRCDLLQIYHHSDAEEHHKGPSLLEGSKGGALLIVELLEGGIGEALLDEGDELGVRGEVGLEASLNVIPHLREWR